MFLAAGACSAPAGAASGRCRMEPAQNPPAPPAGVEIRGNVYRVACVGEPGGGQVTVVSAYHLTMRFPPGAFKEIQYNDGSGWRALPNPIAPGGDPDASGNAAASGEEPASAPTRPPAPGSLCAPGRFS